jgi:serine/threonine protein kinase
VLTFLYNTISIEFSKRTLISSNIFQTQWMAQEILVGNQPYTPKADIYSFGVVLWELVTRKIPFEEHNTWEIPNIVGRGDRPPIPKDCPSKFASLIHSCWQENPSKRPSFTTISEQISKMGEEYHLYI